MGKPNVECNESFIVLIILLSLEGIKELLGKNVMPYLLNLLARPKVKTSDHLFVLRLITSL